jgi:iron complex outermembrane receptor protein
MAMGGLDMRRFRALLSTGAALAASAAWAQTPSDENAGEIIVTADRRAASVQDVPISITALGADTLEQAGIRSTEQLSDLTPGLLVQRSVVGKISIRGVGNENYTIAGDPGVAVHVDGVYVARAAAGLFDLFDVERVEVLRGPQGTLYGRNATGGVINVIPARPDADDFAARLAGELGNYDYRRIEGFVNAPLSEGLAVRVAALGSWRDGFTRNTNADARRRGFGRLDSKDVFGVRGQIGWDDGGPFTARLAVEYLNDDSNLPAYKYLNRPGALPTADFGGGANAFADRFLRTVNQGYELDIPGSGRAIESNADVFLTRQTSAALHLAYDLGGATLSSITGWRRTRFNWLNDGDGSDVFYVNYLQQDASRQVSQEFQLASDGDGRFDWLVGAFFFRETGDSFIALPFTLGFNLPFFIAIDGEARTRALAGFGELRWRATDRLKLTFGARYSNERREARYRYEINFGSPIVANPDEKDNFGSFTPRFVADYALGDDATVYASATRGFKSGGFNLLAIQPGFDPEKVWAYEGGVKSQLADRRVTLNGNFFYYQYNDQQVGQIVNLSSVLTNAARSRVWGAEAEFSARPAGGLELGGTLAYLNAKYKEFCTGDPTLPTAPVSPGCDAANPIDLAGNRLPRAPEWTLTATVGYRFDLGGAGALAARADLRWQSSMFFTQFNRPLISQDGYATLGASLTWTDARERLSVALWGQNLTDTTFFTEVLESGAFNPQLVGQAYVAPPRTWGVRGSVAF